MPVKPEQPPSGIGDWLYVALSRTAGAGRPVRVVRWLLILLITANIAAAVLQTSPELPSETRSALHAFWLLSMPVFVLEYLLRLWLTPKQRTDLYADSWRGLVRLALSPVMLSDLVALLPLLALPGAAIDLRFMRILRLLWYLDIARHLPAIATLGRVLKRERRTLIAVMLIMLTILFVASSWVYLLEHDSQPDSFGSIPHAMWWGVATLTTVGYGDVVPVSTMGRFLGVIIMLLGVGTFAMPAAILASAFYEERKRRDFMVTWDLVARMPLFRSLSAHEIGDITLLLRPLDVMAKEVVFHKGDVADSMYFIVSGELEAELDNGPRQLSASEYFGELGLLYHRPRSATVIARTRAELLELDARDLHQLFSRKPGLRQQIMHEAERRLAQDREIENRNPE